MYEDINNMLLFAVKELKILLANFKFKPFLISNQVKN